MWNNSLFVVGGHTNKSFEVTSSVWRADIDPFLAPPEGMWRPVNTTDVRDSAQTEADVAGRYGHTVTVFGDTTDANQVCAASAALNRANTFARYRTNNLDIWLSSTPERGASHMLYLRISVRWVVSKARSTTSPSLPYSIAYLMLTECCPLCASNCRDSSTSATT